MGVLVEGQRLGGCIRRNLMEGPKFRTEAPGRDAKPRGYPGFCGPTGGVFNGITGAVNRLGCSSHGRLFHWLLGALPPPLARYQTLDEYLAGETAPKSKVPQTASPWVDRPRHIVRLPKAWYGKYSTH